MIIEVEQEFDKFVVEKIESITVYNRETGEPILTLKGSDVALVSMD